MVIKYVRIRLEAWRVCPCQERQKQRASLLRWWGRADSHGFRPMESQALMVWSLIMSLWSGENPLGRFVSDVRILFGSLKRPWIFQFLITTKYCITILYWISVFAFWACHLKACKPLHCTEGSTRWGRWRRLSREIPWASSEGWQSPASSMPACGSTAQKGVGRCWPRLAAVGRCFVGLQSQNLNALNASQLERLPDMSPSPGTQTKWMFTTLAPKLNVWRSKSSRPPTAGFSYVFLRLLISVTWLLTCKNVLVSY
jgi:hypothetical protein